MTNLTKQEKLKALMEKMNKKTNHRSEDDEKFWKPTVSKEGTAKAIIRFIPDPSEMCWQELHTHGFQANGQWYIENCPSTIGQECPVCEDNRKLWNTGLESDKETARKRKRKLSYISNIYVVKDLGNPENDGKVFLYKFGKKIFDKLKALIEGDEDSGIEGTNPWDIEDGFNFSLKQKEVSGFPNFDESEFLRGVNVFSSMKKKEIEELLSQTHETSAIVAVDKFKPYSDLSTRFNKVIGNSEKFKNAVIDDEIPDFDEKPKTQKQSKPSVEEDDFDMEELEKLLED